MGRGGSRKPQLVGDPPGLLPFQRGSRSCPGGVGEGRLPASAPTEAAFISMAAFLKGGGQLWLSSALGPGVPVSGWPAGCSREILAQGKKSPGV